MERKNPLSKESANLNITVTDDADFLSKYSEADKPVISGEVAEFVENVAKAYHPDQSFTLNIKSACISHPFAKELRSGDFSLDLNSLWLVIYITDLHFNMPLDIFLNPYS